MAAFVSVAMLWIMYMLVKMLLTLMLVGMLMLILRMATHLFHPQILLLSIMTGGSMLYIPFSGRRSPAKGLIERKIIRIK
jgi:hypothetical protein